MKIEHQEIIWRIGDKGFTSKGILLDIEFFEVIGVHHSGLLVKFVNGLIRTYTNEEAKTLTKEHS
mgnify:CR=1 FL=1